jgi:hypothetical protein
MRTTRSLATSMVVLSVAALPAAARAGVPGWSTPHTASSVPVGVYGAGPNGQGVQLFGSNGAAQTRTAAMRAITSGATQGSSVPIDAAGRPGMDLPAVAVNANGKLVVAWLLDTLQAGPIGLAATLGARTALPHTATVLPTQASTAGLAVAIGPDGTGIVAWVEAGPPNVVKAATLRAGQAPQVAVLATTTAALPGNLSLGLDGGGRPTVTWTMTTDSGTAIDVARGDATGGFAPATEQPLTTAPVVGAQTFVLSDGALLATWSEGVLPGPVTLTTANAPAGGAFGVPRRLATALAAPQPSVAAAAGGRAAVLYAVRSGSGVALRTILRTASGTWGSTRSVGPSGRNVSRINAGVDGQGRVVILWDDGSASASTPTRILAARSSSSSDPPGAYHQLPQRSGDGRCDVPTLILSSSGDGLGAWLCTGTGASSGQSGRPRLARLTKPS